MKKIFLALLATSFSVLLNAQDKQDSGYVFTEKYMVDVTSVKNQQQSGTCWDFAAISFLEAELMRETGAVYDISEMYFVRKVYVDKVERYIRFHGKGNISPGGQAHDVTNALAKYGAVPEEVYPGIIPGFEIHNHNELDAIMKAMSNTYLKFKNGRLSDAWLKSVEAVLDAYLGEIPETFDFQGKMYTPQSYAEEMNINPEDYIEVTSFTHQPYWEPFVLEVPDNWSHDLYYNVPLVDLVRIMDYALENDYTISWDGDVSEYGFSFTDGVAVVPEKDFEKSTEEEKRNYTSVPGEEKFIDAALRQEEFDKFSMTDDHLMHITGIVLDQNGTKYYVTKNSWGSERNDFDGYLNMSESYVRLNTIAIMIHKDALPKDITKKLEL